MDLLPGSMHNPQKEAPVVCIPNIPEMALSRVDSVEDGWRSYPETFFDQDQDKQRHAFDSLTIDMHNQMDGNASAIITSQVRN
jgi:hypothetical protein